MLNTNLQKDLKIITFCGFFRKFHNRYPFLTLFFLPWRQSTVACFSPQVNFPQDKGNILSIQLKQSNQGNISLILGKTFLQVNYLF
jgi:hypothetical protein